MGKLINSFNGYKYHLPILEKIFNFCLNLDQLPSDEKTEIEFKNNFELNDINFSFDNKNIFKNLNFKFQNTDKIGFYGSSGIGKSTLINIILGLLYPKNGSIKISNDVIKDKFYPKVIDSLWKKEKPIGKEIAYESLDETGKAIFLDDQLVHCYYYF